MKIWRVSDGALPRTLSGHTSAVRSVAYSPDGSIIASSGEAVRLWQSSDLSDHFKSGQRLSLRAGDGVQAAAEFQKVIDHRGIVANFHLGVLAHLQCGRAYNMAGDTGKAREAYAAFLATWQNADPDIPILKQAKAEYAKLDSQGKAVSR